MSETTFNPEEQNTFLSRPLLAALNLDWEKAIYILFILIAFWGTMPNELLWTIFVSNYIFKVGVEVVLTPITYLIVGALKRVEHEDYYDRETNFNPFAVG